jgi:NAD(P)-dependent dehydrogenase (short-subunit alcohol dehydrogenase family)
LGVEVDVRDHEAVEAMVARVVQEWGRVDVLVANAGGGRGRRMDTKASALDPALLQLVTDPAADVADKVGFPIILSFRRSPGRSPPAVTASRRFDAPELRR